MGKKKVILGSKRCDNSTTLKLYAREKKRILIKPTLETQTITMLKTLNAHKYADFF